MFEEVPRERHGVARWLLAHSVGFGPFILRPLAVGPFVLGGGVLLAAVGGSVAVAAAATVLTASAIASDDLPARPQHPVAGASSSHPAPARPQVSRPAAAPAVGLPAVGLPAVGLPAVGLPAVGLPAVGPSGAVPVSSAAAPAASVTASVGGSRAATHSPGPAASAVPAVPPTGGSAAPAPSSSGPLGNALIHISGYDQATGRLAYQFATGSPDGTGYAISGPETFSAVLAPTATIVSGGTLCPPAGSTCTPDQLIAAADSGFFAEVAIDVTGTLRSVLEVGEEAVGVRRVPVPTSGAPAPSETASAPS